MQHQRSAIAAGIIFTYLCVALCSYFSVSAIWAYDHLNYLPSWWLFVLIGSAALSITFLSIQKIREGLESSLEIIGRTIWEGSIVVRLAVVALFTVLFWLLRAHVHFLGDGYGIIMLYAEPISRVKMTSFGSIWLLRGIQSLLGGYTEETSRTAFQIMSIASGAVTISAFLSISRWLTERAALRLLSFLLLIGSGAILLFFGYTELYPPVWAAGSWFFAGALRYLQSKQGLWLVVLVWLVTVAMHMQALLLIFGVILLPFESIQRFFRRSKVSRILVPSAIIVIILGFIAYTTLYAESLLFRVTFLPVLEGRIQSPDYGVLTLPHLLDIMNLLLVIIPALPVLLISLLTAGTATLRQPVPIFFILCGLGIGLFLLTAEPDLGMARDWDLMSFTALPWLLLLIWSTVHSKQAWSAGQVFSVAVLALFVTASYVTVNLHRPSAEQRFYGILQHYGTFNRGGWITLQNYYRELDNIEQAEAIRDEADSLFPDYRLLDSAHALSEAGLAQEAYPIAAELLRKHPNNPQMMQVMAHVQKNLGNLRQAESLYVETMKLRPFIPNVKAQLAGVYLSLHQPDKALSLLESARELDPGNPRILEGLAIAYIAGRQIDSAESIGEVLLSLDPNSATGHLVKLNTAFKQGDLAAARHHYQKFLKYGKDRTDYERLKAFYEPRLNP